MNSNHMESNVLHVEDLFEEVLLKYKAYDPTEMNSKVRDMALHELDTFDIINKCKSMKAKVILKSIDFYEQALYCVFKAIIEMVSNNPIDGNYMSDGVVSNFKKAGQLLFKGGGEDAMYNPKFWSFIPKRYHLDIDCAFDGIGEWKSISNLMFQEMIKNNNIQFCGL